MTAPTFQEVSALIDYDPSTGVFTWKSRPFSRAAKPDRARGYGQLCLGGRGYYAHRVAILLTSGAWPRGPIDHIDGDRTNNRLSNLRVVDALANARNHGIGRRNKSGVLGVFLRKDTGKWSAQIRVHGKAKHLGFFATIEAAAAARKAAERAAGFHPNHGERPSYRVSKGTLTTDQARAA